MTEPTMSTLETSVRQISHQKLALAVIVQAIRDLEADGKHREKAKLFFSSRAVAEWCGVAGLDLDFVNDVVKYLAKGHSQPVASEYKSVH